MITPHPKDCPCEICEKCRRFKKMLQEGTLWMPMPKGLISDLKSYDYEKEVMGEHVAASEAPYKYKEPTPCPWDTERHTHVIRSIEYDTTLVFLPNKCGYIYHTIRKGERTLRTMTNFEAFSIYAFTMGYTTKPPPFPT